MTFTKIFVAFTYKIKIDFVSRDDDRKT